MLLVIDAKYKLVQKKWSTGRSLKPKSSELNVVPEEKEPLTIEDGKNLNAIMVSKLCTAIKLIIFC